MSSITTRHIRHDWPEWVDWDNQKSVKTMCGVRSRPGLCGIPGVTEQNAVVEKNGREVWGWCTHCVRATFPYIFPPALTSDVAPQEIFLLHYRARAAIVRQYVWFCEKKAKNYAMQGLSQNVEAMLKEADRHRRFIPNSN